MELTLPLKHSGFFLFSCPMTCVFVHFAHHHQNLTIRDKHWAELIPISDLNWELVVSYRDVSGTVGWVLHPDQEQHLFPPHPEQSLLFLVV